LSERTSIESANLAEVEEALSNCLRQGRRLTLGLLLPLHKKLLDGVPEEAGHPLKPGCLREATDIVEAAGVEHLTKHMSPAWRVKSDLISLLEAAEEGRLGSRGMETAAKFHYRFVRIHPFCDGNGRMARALSIFLLAQEDEEVLNFEKPVNEVLWEHRGDYVGVLEYCDSIYADLVPTQLTEEEKLAQCEEPFTQFYSLAFLGAYHQHNVSLRRKLQLLGLPLDDLPPPPPDLYDISLEHIKVLSPWDAYIREALVRAYKQ
jgi:fido (protein-threonine AMPylation protein)